MPVRCGWVPEGDELYAAYHDREWGVPSRDDRHLFEMLVLEGAQAGLSWITILRKREGYRRNFANFDAGKVARFGARDVKRCLSDPGIVRNRAKVASAINNAQRTLEVREEFGSFAKYLWGFVDGTPIQNRWKTWKQIPAETPEAKVLSKDLKKRGFSFVGPVGIYAYMQSVGMVNDHTVDCFRYAAVAKVRPRPAKK